MPPMLKISALALLLLTAAWTARADVLAAFTPQNFSQGGPSPWDETSAPDTITLLPGVKLAAGLQCGTGIVSGGTADAWGGSGWNGTDKDSAIADDDSFSVTIAPAEGRRLSFQQIQPIMFRGENSATTCLWQYQVGDGPFTDIGAPVTVATASVKGITLDPVILGTIPELQNVSEPVTFRMLGWGASTKGASWGFGKSTGNPVLTFEGSLSPAP